MSVPHDTPESKQADSSDATADYVVQVTATELRRLRGDSQAVHLWCILLTYADWTTGKCHPSRSTLATEMGASTDTVDRTRRRLQEAGLLETAQRKDDTGNHTSNEYTLIRQRVSAPQRIGMGTPAERVAAGAREGIRWAADQTNTRGTNTKERVPVNKKTSPNKFGDDDLALASFMVEVVSRIQKPAKEPNVENWADTIRLMRERDGRTIEQIRELFIWANEHHFWKANIRSPEKLREQWDRLTIQKQEGNGHANSKRAPLQTRGLRYDPAAPIADHL